MWPFSIKTPEIALNNNDSTSTARLVVILGGTGIIIFGAAYLLKNLYPFFDDLHESNSEADSDDSNSSDGSDESEDSNDHGENFDNRDYLEEKILRDLKKQESDKPSMTLFGF